MILRLISCLLASLPSSVSLGTVSDAFPVALKAGDQFRAQKQFAQAITKFEVAISVAANETESALALAKKGEVLAFDQSEYVAAKAVAEAALRLKKVAPIAQVTVLRVLAECQMKGDTDFEAAATTLERARSLPDVEWAQPQVNLTLGDCYRSAKHFNRALSAYHRVASAAGASKSVRAIAYLNIGLTHRYNLNEADKANAAFVKAVEFDPNLKNEAEKHTPKQQTSTPLVMAHYMPWYSAKPHSDTWGWHWTMNHFDPEKSIDGKRQIASHFYPLIGPYDSGDPHVLEYHLLLMKLAGIDGVIVDWYGLEDFRDYATLHRNTQRLIDVVQRFKMKVIVCYEDQTIPALVKAKKLSPDQRIDHAIAEIDWLAKHWFPLDCFVRIDDKPVLLSFGHAGLTNVEWTQCLEKLSTPVSYFSEHSRRNGAVGAFDWPVPDQGFRQIERFLVNSRNWTQAVPVAFPRFVDIYRQAEISAGYKIIPDDDGATFRKSMTQSFAAGNDIVQIATWNDWGEGTNIEPSQEFGHRDLEFLQQLRRQHIDPDFEPQSDDLRLPERLLTLRRVNINETQALNRIADMLISGQITDARAALRGMKSGN